MAIITISSVTFSGGKEIAEKLARRLNYSCISREMVTTEAAQFFSIDEHQLSDAMAEAICTIAVGVDGVKELVNNINVGSKWLF